MPENRMLGVDDRPATLIKFDAFNADRFDLMGGKSDKGGRSFSSHYFKNNEEYKSLSEHVKEETN